MTGEGGGFLDSAEKHIWGGSFDYYTYTPSLNAKKVLLYPLETGFFHMLDGHCTERDTYPSFQIMYLKSGELTLRTNAMQGVAHGGQFILLDCYQYHRYQSVGPTEMLWMHFDGQAARFYYQQIIAKRGPIFALEQDEKALHPLKTIYNIFRSGTYLSETMLAKYVTDILTWFVDAPVGQGDVDRSSHDIQMVMTYIANHLDEPLDLHQLAAMTGLGERSFIRVFKKATGYTPHAYVIDARINSARSMLSNSSKPVEQIALNCGYSKLSVFCSAFKSKVGMSPMEYRRRTL